MTYLPPPLNYKRFFTTLQTQYPRFIHAKVLGVVSISSHPGPTLSDLCPARYGLVRRGRLGRYGSQGQSGFRCQCGKESYN